MINVPRQYDALARLLAYPNEKYRQYLGHCRHVLAEKHPDAMQFLDRFTHDVESMTIEDLQELYTQAFDLNPICTLELGWQLFGENYSRGEFLVEMRQTLRRLDVPESTELPDHITHVLAAFGRMPAREADRFASQFLLPALEKMLQGLSGSKCPYEDVLEAIRAVVLSPYGIDCPSPSASEGPRDACASLALRLGNATEEVGHG
ncbi:MAG: nitrate reductase molybdenum cofactor assembly chaperone [Planctomycetes bacterium]|nr:nitrate reductase molybdenum cofactor assembly chaperone [Planctomycetota bacterium]